MHLLRGDPRPVCEYCRQALSIRPFLITCPCYAPIRSRHYRSTNLTHLLNHVQPSRILKFLTEIKLFDKIWLFTFNLNLLFLSSFVLCLSSFIFLSNAFYHVFFCLSCSSFICLFTLFTATCYLDELVLFPETTFAQNVTTRHYLTYNRSPYNICVDLRP